MTDEYGFMAERDGDTVTISDCNGGGTQFEAYTRDDAAQQLHRYMERVIREYAEDMADDLFKDDEDEASSGDSGGDQ